MSTIAVSRQKWVEIRGRIKEDHGAATAMLKTRMKTELGFVYREYREWLKKEERYHEDIRLDFYDDQKEILFRLKYL
ncbi:MAG TPA: hypothetical protein VFM18_18235 [Methanosarcina sp.]|nr:hypothetical protein [Methanosarcina sp.]